MKLSKRIWDLARAGLSAPRRFSGLGKAGPLAKMEARLEAIRKSLTRAAAREKQVRDELEMAEQQGRERDAVRLRRDLADLARSTDELRAALELIEARIEMERERGDEAALPPSTPGPLAAAETESLQAPEADEGSEIDLAARKARLSAPRGQRGPARPESRSQG